MIIRRGYYDMMDNEEWLNEMVQDGYAMTDYKMGLFLDSYSFEKCTPCEYNFRVLMLENDIKHVESMKYLRFLRESGVEHVGTSGKAVYLRKKADSGPFDILTDRGSRLKYHSKMVRLYVWSVLAYPICFAIAIGVMVLSQLLDVSSTWWYFGSGMFGGLAIAFLATCVVVYRCFQAIGRHRKVVKRLKNEGLVYE